MLALGLVISLLVLSFTGIHYVIVESADNYELAVREAARINDILQRSGETSLRARPSHARPANPYCAILLGPYFSESAADDARTRLLQSIPNLKAQKPAVVNYTIRNLGTITSRR